MFCPSSLNILPILHVLCILGMEIVLVNEPNFAKLTIFFVNKQNFQQNVFLKRSFFKKRVFSYDLEKKNVFTEQTVLLQHHSVKKRTNKNGRFFRKQTNSNFY